MVPTTVARSMLIAAALGGILLVGCSNNHATRVAAPVPAGAASTVSAGGTAAERAAPTETSPGGDIPDSRAFVSYTDTTGGYSLDAPEGWARTVTGANVRFVDKLDGESVTVTQPAVALSAAANRTELIAAVMAVGRAVTVNNVTQVQLPAGTAALVDYTANSDPDPVTGKQVRLEQNSYFFFQSGKQAMVTVWAPTGADNVDQWQRIAHSFRWI